VRLPLRPLAFAALLSCLLSSDAGAQSATDADAVRRAALDYLDGFYEYGFVRTAAGDYRGSQMRWPEGFMGYSRGVRETGRGAPPPGAPKEVIVFEVLDQTASAKVVAWWGIDYLLMGKVDGRWQITHVLWQSPPPAAPR
jgi:hypothetical protein